MDDISPAEVEAALLDGYAGFVRLAYLILPPALGRHCRILAAHGVVQRVLPDRRRLERQLAGETDATEYLRRRVVQDSIRQATSRTPLRLLPQIWGLRLFPQSGAADDLAVDQALATSSPEGRAAWALVRSEQLSVDETELQLRATGVQHPQAAITEAAVLEENTADDWDVFDPCAVRLAPTDLLHRRARGRAVTIAVTAVLAVAILTSLISTAFQDERTPIASPQAVKADLPKLTAEVARPTCSSWPTLQLRSPREATSSAALLTWAQTACSLQGLQNQTAPPLAPLP